MNDKVQAVKDAADETNAQNAATCEVCGDPMPEGEEMFKFHGYSGECPKLPLKKDKAEFVDSASDDRTVNNTNVMRHAYKVLGDEEKNHMVQIKDAGLNFHNLLENIGESREMEQAKIKIEEAVMWAVKHITK